MERRKGNFLIIFDHFIKDFWGTALMILVIAINGVGSLKENIFIIIIGVGSPIASFVKYFTTYYSINDEMLIIESGFFTKSKTEIPLKAITTVDLTQNLIYQMFDVYRIKIDNASQLKGAAQKAEATFALKKEEALQVKELILSKRETVFAEIDKSVQKEESFHAGLRDFVLLGLLQSKIAYLFSGIAVIFAALNIFASFGGSDDVDIYGDASDYLINSLIPKIGIAYLVLSLIAVIIGISIVTIMIRYHRYKVSSSDEAIYIEYGLLNKKNYSLIKTKISGVQLQQSLLMRIFGYYTVNVFAIGYGDSDNEEKEVAMLFPIVKLNVLKEQLKIMLPELTIAETVTKPEKQAFHYFYYNIGVPFSVLLFISMCIVGETVLIVCSAALMILSLIYCFLRYKNAGLNINREAITVITGGFGRNTIIIKTSSIESVAETASYFKHKKGFTSILISTLAPLRVAKIAAKHVTIKQFEAVKEILIY